jgi:NAD(P)-dependent dehydrogenase (short-subunit alcohol dehydrogenase family)
MLVTGGACGIGAAIAEASRSAGYRVGVLDVADAGGAALAGVEYHCVSVADEQGVDAAIDAFGTPDVVVNNAGIVRFGPLADLALDDFRAVLEVNLTGTFVVARAVARRWIDAGRGGVIVNTTSINGIAAGPNAGSYGTAKAGVALLTSQMALEWGPLGIRVNAVAPGLIDAGMSTPIYADADTRAARSSRVPLGRLGTAADIADAVLFLASDQASYIHGQNIVVDGGVVGSVISALPRPASVDSVGHAR